MYIYVHVSLYMFSFLWKLQWSCWHWNIQGYEDMSAELIVLCSLSCMHNIHCLKCRVYWCVTVCSSCKHAIYFAYNLHIYFQNSRWVRKSNLWKRILWTFTGKSVSWHTVHDDNFMMVLFLIFFFFFLQIDNKKIVHIKIINR